MKKQYLIVEHRNSLVTQKQREQIIELNTKIEKLSKQYKDLEAKYGLEVFYNNALCDLCKLNGISYKPIFDHKKRCP